MQILKTICLAAMLGLMMISSAAYPQNPLPKKKNLSQQHAPQFFTPQQVKEAVERNKKSGVKSDKKRGSSLYEEDFENGIFPPSGWSVESGTTEWQQAFVSGYGEGKYSIFFDNYSCTNSNSITTSSFPALSGSTTLTFDYAYTPYYDGGYWVDDFEIMGYHDGSSSWISLAYYKGLDIITGPETSDYFVPENDEWGTKVLMLPDGISALQFIAHNGCGNNIYVDNLMINEGGSIGDVSLEFVWSKGKLPIGFGTPDRIPVLVKNVSAVPLTNINAVLDITGSNILHDEILIPYIGPGDTLQIDFLGFTPVLPGICEVKVELFGDIDNSNNLIMKDMAVNSNTYRHVDTNCCNGGVGWVGENAFVSKYYMNGTGQVSTVSVRINPDAQNPGQIVYGIVYNSAGMVVGKSPLYEMKASDNDNYKYFNITDPKPPVFTNEDFYVGIAQTAFAGDGSAYGPLSYDYTSPARPDANHYGNLVPVGTFSGVYEFPREWGLNYAIETILGTQSTVDAGVSDPGLQFDQYFSTSTYTPVARVFNAGTGPATFTVNRKITPGSYTSTKSVTSLAAGGTSNVTFDPFVFVSGTKYTVRDSVILPGDLNLMNNVYTTTITPRVAKQLCILWAQVQDRDSLVRSVMTDGRFASNFDTVRMHYTGTFRPWKYVFYAPKDEGIPAPWLRDSLKAYLDASTAPDKKSLIVFSDNIAFHYDPNTGFPQPADTIFYRQYLKAQTISESWTDFLPASQNKVRGLNILSSVTQDTLAFQFAPDLIKAVNGSAPALKPKSVTGSGNDSCHAVYYTGTTFNTMFAANKFSYFRATPSSSGPVVVYARIMDWLTGVTPVSKTLNLTAKIEGFYNSGTNTMIPDTVRVYVRSSVSPFARIDSAKGVLNSSGNVALIFNNSNNGVGYYLEVKHRNAVNTWSRTTQMFVSNSMTYNFSTDSAKAYSNNMKKQGSSWVFYGGDPNQDGTVNLTDMISIYNNSTSFATGYLLTDVNGDNVTNLADVILDYNNAALFVKSKTPLTPSLIAGNSYTEVIATEAVRTETNSNTEFIPDNDIYERTKNESKNEVTLKKTLKFIDKEGNTHTMK